MTCELAIREDDPLSASATWHWHSRRRREGWDIEIRSRTRLTSSETDFLIETDLEVFEDGRQVFARQWSDRAPRDGV